nr:hypothetical protein [Halomonas aerodenitrificans]
MRWEESGEPNLARAIITHGTLEQAIEIAVTENGQPRWVQFQPFGGYLDDFQNFEGFTLPTQVEAGNHFGTEAYFPFFRARVGEVRFLVL